MSCIFYELARHDEIRQKVQNEIDSVLSSESEISYTDLKSLEYLDMVIKGKIDNNKLNLWIPFFGIHYMDILNNETTNLNYN